MPRRKSSEPWERPSGITLKEAVEALRWYGVEVSFDGLRQTVRLLDVPAHKDRGVGGRGITSYYSHEALWMLATAYRSVATPKSKFERIAATLKSKELGLPEPYSIAEMFNDQPVAAPRDIDAVNAIYLEFVTDPVIGLDLRVVADVVRGHGADVGIYPGSTLASQLRAYCERTLLGLGVPLDAAVSTSCSLFNSCSKDAK